MKQYLNQEGKMVIISEMPDAYLLNSLSKQRKNLEVIKQKLQSNPTLAVFVAGRVRELEELVESLRAEVVKRDIL